MKSIPQKDSNARYMRNKSWHLWNEWQEVFGKDHAAGVRVCDTPDAVNKIYGKTSSSNATSGPSTHMILEELFLDEMYGDGVLPEMVDESRPTTEIPALTIVNKVLKKERHRIRWTESFD